MAPAVNARRRAFSMLRDKEAVELLFDEVAPRFTDRTGGYTRVLRMAFPRLGDAGIQGIIEFVGKNDRVKQKSEKPAFESEAPADEAPAEEAVAEEESSEEVVDEATSDDPTAEAAADAGDDAATDEGDAKEEG